MRSVAAVLLLLPLAACGGGSDEPAPAASSTAAAPVEPTASPTVETPEGKAVPQALSAFRCESDGEGRFRATGALTNASKAKVTFQVTVLVGDASAGEQRARTQQVPSIAPGGSVTFEIPRIPAPEGGGTCHVQVLTTK